MNIVTVSQKFTSKRLMASSLYGHRPLRVNFCNYEPGVVTRIERRIPKGLPFKGRSSHFGEKRDLVLDSAVNVQRSVKDDH